MFTVYVLYSEIGKRFYTGFTKHLERRLREHNAGYTKSTKAFAPWKMIYSEEVNSRLKAREREKYFKSGIGREFIKSIFKAP